MNVMKSVLIASIAALAVAACGGSASPTIAPPVLTTAPVVPATAPVAPTTAPGAPVTTPIGGSIDACSLLTSAEISAATGKTYDAGKLDSVGECTWNTNGSVVNDGSLIIGYIQPSPFALLKQSFALGGVDATVNGHAALWNPTQGLGSMWVDIGGDQTFVLSFPRSNDLDPSYQAIAQQLAELAVGRI